MVPETSKTYKSLSIVLLCLAILGCGLAFGLAWLGLWISRFNGWLLFWLLIAKIAFCFVPAIILLFYLSFDAKKLIFAQCSLALIALEELFLLLLFGLRFWYSLFAFFQTLLAFFALIISLIVIVEITRRQKISLPWICLLKTAIVILLELLPCVFLGYDAFFMLFALLAFSTMMFWIALFVMTKFDLIRFIKDEMDEATKELRALKTLFETNQISEEEYKKRKFAVMLNIKEIP